MPTINSPLSGVGNSLLQLAALRRQRNQDRFANQISLADLQSKGFQVEQQPARFGGIFGGGRTAITPPSLNLEAELTRSKIAANQALAKQRQRGQTRTSLPNLGTTASVLLDEPRGGTKGFFGIGAKPAFTEDQELLRQAARAQLQQFGGGFGQGQGTEDPPMRAMP